MKIKNEYEINRTAGLQTSAERVYELGKFFGAELHQIGIILVIKDYVFHLKKTSQ